VDGRGLDAQFRVLVVFDIVTSLLLVVSLYLCKQAVKMDEFLLFHVQPFLITRGL